MCGNGLIRIDDKLGNCRRKVSPHLHRQWPALEWQAIDGEDVAILKCTRLFSSGMITLHPERGLPEMSNASYRFFSVRTTEKITPAAVERCAVELEALRTTIAEMRRASRTVLISRHSGHCAPLRALINNQLSRLLRSKQHLAFEAECRRLDAYGKKLAKKRQHAARRAVKAACRQLVDRTKADQLRSRAAAIEAEGKPEWAWLVMAECSKAINREE